MGETTLNTPLSSIRQPQHNRVTPVRFGLRIRKRDLSDVALWGHVALTRRARRVPPVLKF